MIAECVLTGDGPTLPDVQVAERKQRATLYYSSGPEKQQFEIWDSPGVYERMVHFRKVNGDELMINVDRLASILLEPINE